MLKISESSIFRNSVVLRFELILPTIGIEHCIIGDSRHRGVLPGQTFSNANKSG